MPVIRRFKSAASAQQLLDAFNHVGDLLRPRGYLLRVVVYRARMRQQVTTWREVAGPRAA